MKKLAPIDSCLQRESEFSVIESHWVYKPHLKAGPMPSKKVPTQNELNGTLGVLSHNDFFGLFLFLLLTGLFMYILVSLCFYGEAYICF